ncbi:MAG: hypothetical protein KDF95_09375 [Rhodocyclaceae bacterium]|nr:hypothetical protein [Rhodocyclaceae bacterium]
MEHASLWLEVPEVAEVLPDAWRDESLFAARLRAIDVASYARTRNHLDGAVTGLSPWIGHGFSPVAQVVAWLARYRGLRARHKLAYEFAWREYFHHVWARLDDGILTDIRPGLAGVRYAREVPGAVREARTGLAPVDQAVRTLYRSGYLHNHARMWLASFLVHYAKVDWRVGADWMYSYLLDGDFASNHLSWQWVAATFGRKPYLFNAENVARFAPADWQCAGSALDADHATLDALARSSGRILCGCRRSEAVAVPPALACPPPALLEGGDGLLPAIAPGRTVILLHPWHLRPPPRRPDGALVLGVVHLPFHRRFPWSSQRWHFVLPRLRKVCDRLFVGDASMLAPVLGKRRVIAERTRYPDYREVLRVLATELREPPRWLPDPPALSPSFSHYWRRYGPESRKRREPGGRGGV